MSLANVRTFAILFGLILAAVVLTVSTYGTFNHTYDEPAHIAAGMELVDRNRYDYELTHGPLARLAVAIGPYLDGSRSHGQANIYAEGRAILYGSGNYERTLTLARLGNLPFLILFLVVAFLWGRRAGGVATGLLAAFFLATLPPVLGNAAIATTDIAAASTAALALYALVCWVENPTLGAGALVGVACGLAVASKLSAVPFVAIAVAALVVCILLVQPQLVLTLRQPRCWKSIGMAVLGTLVALWLAYGGRLAPAAQLDTRIDGQVDKHLGSGALHSAARFVVDDVPVPIYFIKLPLGFRWAARLNGRGHLSYLLGETSMQGWWYYYPVNLAVRTPIPLMLLGVVGLVLLGVQGWRSRSLQMLFPAAAFVALLLLCMTLIRFNLGLRHIFILFAPLAVAAAFAVRTVLNSSGRTVSRAAIGVLLAWQLLTPCFAAPDQLAYFNAFAGSHPEKILVVADLDWGQDLRRLEGVLRERHIETLHLAYQGTADLTKEPLPKFTMLPPGVPVNGWIAISLTKMKRGGTDYAWLDAFAPVARVGCSIDLYYIDKAPAATALPHNDAADAESDETEQ